MVKIDNYVLYVLFAVKPSCLQVSITLSVEIHIVGFFRQQDTSVKKISFHKKQLQLYV